jgi:type IV pilus assembly protein PilC
VKYQYTGFDKGGQAARGVVEAATLDAARDAALRKGVYVSAIGEARPAGAGAQAGGFGAGRRMMLVAGFMRQLAVLADTGTTLVDAITSLEKQAKDAAWAGVLSRVRERVEEGAQLSDAMAAHPAYFDPICRSLVAAGESGGKLGDMLRRLSVFMRQRVKLRKTITGSMAYPCLLLGVAVVVVVAMLGFVMPRFEGLFKTIDAKLPPTTEFLMNASAGLRAHWYVPAGLAVLVPLGLWAWLRSAAGRRAWEGLVLRAPAIGTLSRAFATARVARVLGVLLEGRVPMVEALRLTKASAGREAYAALVARSEDAVTRGEPFSGAFADSTLIPPSVYEAIRSGERNGQVGPVLMQIADHLDEDNEMALKTLVGLVEPLILIAMGLVVGTMAVSMFLPLFDLAASGGRH